MIVSRSPITSDNLFDENLTTNPTEPAITGIVVMVAVTMARGETFLLIRVSDECYNSGCYGYTCYLLNFHSSSLHMALTK